MKIGWMTAMVGGALLCAASASAQTTVVRAPPGEQVYVEPRGETATSTYVPNVGLVASGAVLFLGGYIPSIVVAASSSNSSDNMLWIPVVGPWLDLGDRGGCPVGRSCDTETTNKMLLIGDGILQGVGVLALAAGFIFPQKTTTYVAKPRVRLTPMQLGRGPSMGAGVVGTF